MRAFLRDLMWMVAAIALTGLAAAAQAQDWKPLPWHVVNVRHAFAETAFDSLRVTVDIAGDVEEGDYVYIAPAYARVGGVPFYFGLQTDLLVAGENRGKGFIFSRWGRLQSDDARPAPGGWHAALDDAASGEGDFVGVRLQYPWTAGSYTFLLTRRPARRGGADWFDLVVFDHQRRQWVDAGGLRFPADGPPTLENGIISFLELYPYPYGRAFPRGYQVPDLAVTFGAPMVNGREPARRSSLFTPPKVPPLAATTLEDGEATVRLGTRAAEPADRPGERSPAAGLPR